MVFLILQNKLKIISAEPIHFHCCITIFMFLKKYESTENEEGKKIKSNINI